MASKHPTDASDYFVWPIRVYYEDTDAGGVVYHAAYLRFCERARTEWLRHRGFDQSLVRERYGVLFAVRRMAIEFIKAAHFDDRLDVSVENLVVRPARFALEQTIRRDDDVICQARVEAACVDAEAFSPRRIPEDIKKVISP